MPNEKLIKQESKSASTLPLCFVISLCLLVYIIIFIGLSDYLWYSYDESSCYVVNNTIFESESQSEAVWIVNVHSKQLNFSEYLADIRQTFDAYYAAYEAILIIHPIGSPHSCYVHSKYKFKIRWTKSSTEGIVSAIFGVGTLLFIIIMAACVQYLLRKNNTNRILIVSV